MSCCGNRIKSADRIRNNITMPTSSSSNKNDPEAELLDKLKHGNPLVKHKSNGKGFSRQFYLNEPDGYISYQKSDRIFRGPRIYRIRDINEVRSGFRAQTFDSLLRRGLMKSDDERRAFSIMYNNHRSQLHLMAPDEHIRDLWIQGLQHLLDRNAHKSQRHVLGETNWILGHFRSADKDGSNTLTKKECRSLLADSLCVKIPENLFEKFFKQADTSGEGVLSADEFMTFFHLLTRRNDLFEIMQKHVKDGHKYSMETIRMNLDELVNFLLTTQQQTYILHENKNKSQEKFTYQLLDKREQVKEWMDDFELDKTVRDQGLLSFDGFRNMLLSTNFHLMKPWCARQVYQDMTRPLCDYYINTSHNTYLFDSQITGDSNPEAYNRALHLGCRCVELDCYDGDDGRPIVTHAHTLVRPCLFESIIRYMEPNLFKKSPYPVILNIENHCSWEQQKTMAKILKTILGDRLLTEPLPTADPSVLPSPEDLKYKVLVRSRKISKSTTPNKSLQQEDDDDSFFDPLTKHVPPDLSDLFVYLQNVPFKGYDYARKHYSCYHSSSLVENRLDTIAREDPIHLIQQTTWRILRTYPGGLRQDSSNQNPINSWNFGVQMAALNCQNADDMMALCYGKFRDNGNCGYVLKPDYLINACQTRFNPFDPPTSGRKFDVAQRLRITIISAQFLSPSNVASSSYDIMDPYVIITTHGIPCDERTQRTTTVSDNGLNPTWNQTFEFHINYPRMCLVHFSVYDSDALSRDDLIADFSLPATTIQSGYRHIHLRTNNNEPTYSTLFVHVKIEEDEILSTRL